VCAIMRVNILHTSTKLCKLGILVPKAIEISLGILILMVLCSPTATSLNELCNATVDCQFRVGGSVVCTPFGCQCSDFHLPFQLFEGLGREECLPVATDGPGSHCKYDTQCSFIMGEYSHCSKETYPLSCQCVNSSVVTNSLMRHWNSRLKYNSEVVYIRSSGLCIVRKKVGEECDEDEECKKSIGRGSICIKETNTCSEDNSSVGNVFDEKGRYLIGSCLVVVIAWMQWR